MKAVAVPYIIAIILGVAVIGLVGYWFFVSGGRFGATTVEQQCRTDFSKACSLWAARAYADDIESQGLFKADPTDEECTKKVVKDKAPAGLDRNDYLNACLGR